MYLHGMRKLIVSGATGFLGRELVAHLLGEDASTHLGLLVRGKDDADAQRRVDALLAEVVPAARLSDARARTQVIRADLEKERLGLDPKAYEALVAETTGVIHGAASVSFSLPLDEARRINVDGTRRMLDLAKGAGARLDYVGTAYVAGDRVGVAREDELAVGQPFRNTYEETKLEAEQLVRARGKDQPTAIYRPSIIVGDSKTGRTASFKVLYWPLKLYAQGFARVVPGRRRTPVDVVPSDYVVQAIAHLRKQPSALGQTFHLTAGLRRDSTVGALTDLASEFFRVRPPLFVDPEWVLPWFRPLVDRLPKSKLRHRMLTARVYTPYLNMRVRYDASTTERALAGTGIEVPAVESYFRTVFQYCVDTNWGRAA